MNKIALLDSSPHKPLTGSDLKVAEIFAKDFQEVVWLRVGADFQLPEIQGITHASPIRCWGYHTKPDAFRAMLAALEEQGVTLVNDHRLVLWNLDKSYLSDLASRGVPIQETLYVSEEDLSSAEQHLRQLRWNEVVIKPAISASSFHTQLIKGTSLEFSNHLKKLIPQCGSCLVQPVAHELIDNGELSLVFIKGEYSHGVLKKPRAGEFRSQPEFGSTLSPWTTDDSVLEQAQRILKSLDQQPYYARLDGYLSQGQQWITIEVELIEPALFLNGLS